MNLFLDSSVILAACGRPSGASHHIFDIAAQHEWRLLTSTYVITEVGKNLQVRLPPSAGSEWRQLASRLQRVADVVTFEWPTLLEAGKDRPILFTAVAFADVLLTLDRIDFGGFMTTGFYGLQVFTPGDFLRGERAAGRLLDL